jgi:polyisoprenoid-binding protein YceI
VSIQAGTHKLGPDNAVLQVRTGRHGAAAKAGHDLVIEVAAWEATLVVGEDQDRISLELRADAGSLRVREGTGGVQELTDEDKAEIGETIVNEVLGEQPIEFRSTDAHASEGGRRLRVAGELEMAGARHPLEFGLSVSRDGEISGGATLKQTDWGIEPYSTLFGALKVQDEVAVVAEARVSATAG